MKEYVNPSTIRILYYQYYKTNRIKWFIRNKMEIILVALVYLDEKYARYVIDVLN